MVQKSYSTHMAYPVEVSDEFRDSKRECVNRRSCVNFTESILDWPAIPGTPSHYICLSWPSRVSDVGGDSQALAAVARLPVRGIDQLRLWGKRLQFFEFSSRYHAHGHAANCAGDNQRNLRHRDPQHTDHRHVSIVPLGAAVVGRPPTLSRSATPECHSLFRICFRGMPADGVDF